MTLEVAVTQAGHRVLVSHEGRLPLRIITMEMVTVPASISLRIDMTASQTRNLIRALEGQLVAPDPPEGK